MNRAHHDDETPFSGTLADAWAPRADARRSGAGHRRVLKILLRAGADINTEGIARTPFNAFTWALVDAVSAAGGWPQYAALNPPTTFASVVNKAIHGALPEPLPLEIATFLVPAGGF